MPIHKKKQVVSGTAVSKSSRLQEAKKNEKVIVISNDLVRSLKSTPLNRGAKRCTVLSTNELQRIKMEAQGKSVSSSPVASASNLSKQKEAERIAKERAERILAMEEARQKHNLSIKDEVIDEQTKAILERAKRLQEEQEDEIKKMNQYIAEAKCMSVREAQIAERNMIKQSVKSEEQRLDEIMEHNRLKSIQDFLEREEKRKEKIRESAEIVKSQIEERKEAAMLEADKREKETKRMLEELDKANEEDHKKHEKQEEAKRQLLNEILNANYETIARKKQEKQLSREEDLKIVQYLLDKAKQEEEKELQEKLRKIEKEKEYARLRALQEKLSDKKAEMDGLRAKRAAEEYEREWRRKEKEAAERKVKQERALLEAREQQKLFKEQVITVEALKTRKEFQIMLKSQKEAEEKIAQEKKRKEEANHNFLHGLRKQIENIETQRKKEKHDFLDEGIKFQERIKDRKKHLEEIKQRKIQELRKLGVPEQQCNEIMRKMILLDQQKLSSQAYFGPSKKAEAVAGKGNE